MLGLGNDIDAHIVSISTSLWFQIIVTQLEEDNKQAFSHRNFAYYGPFK
jgi:hypothetical protein